MQFLTFNQLFTKKKTPDQEARWGTVRAQVMQAFGLDAKDQAQEDSLKGVLELFGTDRAADAHSIAECDAATSAQVTALVNRYPQYNDVYTALQCCGRTPRIPCA